MFVDSLCCRFDYNQSFGGKISKHVEYAEYLNLRPFMTSQVKKTNLIQGSKGTLEYETCIIQDFSWIRIFQIDSRIVLIKAYNM